MEKLIPYIVPALIIIVVMVIVLTGYVKASPDVAIII